MNDKDNGLRLISDRSASDDAVVVERLLRLAGHRPEVPAQDTEIVKQAARAEWQRTVKAQRRRSFYTRGAGGLLAAAALAVLVLNAGLLQVGWLGSGDPVATVEMMTGQVTALTEKTGPAAVALDETLLPGTIVETAASRTGAVASRVAFRLAAGISIRLDVDTRVRVLSATVLALDRGALYADSGPSAPASGRSLEIRTPLGVVSDIGTQFMVRLDDPVNPLEVPVREGKVILDRDGESHEAEAGNQMAVLPDGTVETTKVPLSGALWEWMLDVRPPFNASGKTLHQVLAWAQRETGLHVRYVGVGLAADAAKNVVSGPVTGMTPEEAACAFVEASGLTYRLEDGVLTVERATP